MDWLRMILGVLVLILGAVILAALDAREWQFPLLMVGLGPVIIVSGLLLGLNEEPPPWRRRARRR